MNRSMCVFLELEQLDGKAVNSTETTAEDTWTEEQTHSLRESNEGWILFFFLSLVISSVN